MNPGTKVKLRADDEETWVVKGDSWSPYKLALVRDEEDGRRISLNRSPGDLVVTRDAPVYTVGQKLNYRDSRVEVIEQIDDAVRVTFLDYNPTADNGEPIDVGNNPQGYVLVCDLVLANPLGS